MSKVQKKNEMVIVASSKYDLDTGNKLFSPKTIVNSSRSSVNIPNSAIRNKNSLNY